jgi:hypothetical protein
VFFEEFSTFYRQSIEGRELSGPLCPFNTPTSSRWQRDAYRGPLMERHTDFWREHLAGIGSTTAWPVDHPRPPIPTFRGEVRQKMVSQQLTQDLKPSQHGRAVRCSWCCSRASKPSCTATPRRKISSLVPPVAGRNRLETEKLIGFFVNTLLLRTKVQPDCTVHNFARHEGQRDDPWGLRAPGSAALSRWFDAIAVERSSGTCRLPISSSRCKVSH